MAHPQRERKRRDEADEDRLHQRRDDQNRGDRHPADERHSNQYGDAADRDRDRRERADESGHTNRYGSRGANDAGTSRSPRIGGEPEPGQGHDRTADDTQSRGGDPSQGRESYVERGGHRESQRGRDRDDITPTTRETGGNIDYSRNEDERDRRYGSRRGHGTHQQEPRERRD
ncbi:hypothetical protein [Halorussus amylolyticus]|uniref:hypothetical protein n=1 Tax=Halorussus amylolyticus TaxID=1126242 RepID=UPI0010510B31|nr:hypothetical protein [Halorussus amylolyticus]